MTSSLATHNETSLERFAVRVRRFFSSVHPRMADIDRALAEEWLSSDELVLFLSQSPADQQHGLAVAKLLLRNGYSCKDLLAAALLHDVGKRSATMTPWHRTAIVILEAIAPKLLARLGRSERKLFIPFAVHARHAHNGAVLAQEAGASERTIFLVAMHHLRAQADDEELKILQWADEHA